MLHARRRRLADLAAREAAGEVFWTEEFETPLRNRLVHLVELLDPSGVFRKEARSQILREMGMFFLAQQNNYPANDFTEYLKSGGDDMMPTALEAIASAFDNPRAQGEANRWDYAEPFGDAVNTLLREHRISYELIEQEMVPFSSRELHVEVVAPALRLLAADESWSGVETAYRKALEELSRNDAADAITDAGTALQEALKQLGCDGNALGPLIKSARAKGIIAAHDAPLLDVIEKAMQWVSADRSNSGDAHNAEQVGAEDAWLTVHVVGALLLRLSKKTARPTA